ncbi:MAG: gliding motility-associated C-terminal domain-containing protein [Saprospiraceae bacterium]|nr:gliding motility-associated C-terminal domain-containing protein [Candidatus Opimibacter skivensis]
MHNEIYIPNVFSPNDDGINDLFALSFLIGSAGHRDDRFHFDRWGNLQYGSDAPFEWNGFFADEAMMPGVYAYLIRCTYLKGSVEKERVLQGM